MKSVCSKTVKSVRLAIMNHSLTGRLTAFLILALVAAVCGEEGFSGAFNPQLGKLQSQVQFESSISLDESVHGQKTDLGMARYGLQMLLPLRQNESFESAVFSNIQDMEISTRARLEDAVAEFPDHLWDIGLGGRLRRKLDNDWIAGVSLAISSPSDKPFDSLEETGINATGTLQIPAGNGNHHQLLLNYASNREFLRHIPIPGYAYQWSNRRDAQLLLGFPFSWGLWKLTDKVTLNAAYFMPRTVHAQVSYEMRDGLEFYGGFDWQNQRWFRNDRADDDDRIFYYEKKTVAGLRWKFVKNWIIDLHGGYGFDRFFFEGEDYNDRQDNRISLSDGLFIGAQTVIRF